MGELATVRYGIKSDGKIKVESKDEMKKRGLPSPDVADAFVLTFAEAGAAEGAPYAAGFLAGDSDLSGGAHAVEMPIRSQAR